MFESGIGPGVRSNRFGTWSLISFLLLFLPFSSFFLPIGFALVEWIPLLACAFTTLGALGCGLVGVFIRDQRRAAFYGLLKAVVPSVAGVSVFLFILALSSSNIE
jgi:hypothetical protein